MHIRTFLMLLALTALLAAGPTATAQEKPPAGDPVIERDEPAEARPSDPVIEPDEDAFTPQEIEEINQALADLSDEQTETLATALDAGESVTVAGRTLGPDELSTRSDNVVIDTLEGVSQVSAPLTLVGLVGLILLWVDFII